MQPTLISLFAAAFVASLAHSQGAPARKNTYQASGITAAAPRLISPEVHADLTVTFRIRAPKATEVAPSRGRSLWPGGGMECGASPWARSSRSSTSTRSPWMARASWTPPHHRPETSGDLRVGGRIQFRPAERHRLQPGEAFARCVRRSGAREPATEAAVFELRYGRPSDSRPPRPDGCTEGEAESATSGILLPARTSGKSGGTAWRSSCRCCSGSTLVYNQR